jgi:uncharacterized protein with GYD domain
LEHVEVGRGRIGRLEIPFGICYRHDLPKLMIDLSVGLREKRTAMALYIVLINFTEQGIRNIKDSPKRAAAATELARGFGIEIRDIFWTLGAFDGAVLMEAPNDHAVTSWALKLGSLGNVRTQTLRAFRVDEIENILAKVK